MPKGHHHPESQLSALVNYGLSVLAVALLGLASHGLAAGLAQEAGGQLAKVVALDKLNTVADEDHPCLATSGLMLTYSSNAQGDVDLMVASRRQKNQPFATGRLIEELSGKGDDDGPFPLAREADGSEYLYLSRRVSDTKNFDVYFTRKLKQDQPYQRVALAPVHQVCTEADEKDPWVSADLKEMYFSRKTPAGWRVGWARGKEPRAFETVTLVDLPAGFHHPSLSKDLLTMYLQGPGNDSRQALFVSKRATKSARWGKPKPLQLGPRDGKRGDVSPSLARDGTGFYFASDQSGGQGGLDLYFMSAFELQKAGS